MRPGNEAWANLTVLGSSFTDNPQRYSHYNCNWPSSILKSSKVNTKGIKRNPDRYFHQPKLHLAQHSYWLIRKSTNIQVNQAYLLRAPTIKFERLDRVVLLPVLSITNVVQVPGGRQNGVETCPSHVHELLIQLAVYPNLHHCVSFQLQQAHNALDGFWNKPDQK